MPLKIRLRSKLSASHNESDGKRAKGAASTRTRDAKATADRKRVDREPRDRREVQNSGSRKSRSVVDRNVGRRRDGKDSLQLESENRGEKKPHRRKEGRQFVNENEDSFHSDAGSRIKREKLRRGEKKMSFVDENANSSDADTLNVNRRDKRKHYPRADKDVRFVSEEDESFDLHGKNTGVRRKIVRGKGAEVGEDKLNGKDRKFNHTSVSGLQKVDTKDTNLDEKIKSEEQSVNLEEMKRRKFPTRVLDKTGKKIRVSQKAAEAESPDVITPKKKKRVIKLDPYDISNKRLDGTVQQTDSATEQNDVELSKNAQFRAIQPSSSILSFVEENLIGRRRLVELQNAGYNVKISAPLDNIPFSASFQREPIEESVFKSKLEFFAAAKVSSSFPPPVIPEIAFAGRSNVGKSSLLNALSRQWGVVRTSDKPGLTQTINFFRLASKLCLVDLPGYGFAYAKEELKEAWEELVKEYVSTRVGLQRVCLLIDTKWGMKPRDHELIELMERSQTPYQIVLTKTDVVFPIDVARRAMQIQEELKKNKSIVNPVTMVSSKSGAGVRHLRTVLGKLARFVK